MAPNLFQHQSHIFFLSGCDNAVRNRILTAPNDWENEKANTSKQKLSTLFIFKFILPIRVYLPLFFFFYFWPILIWYHSCDGRNTIDWLATNLFVVETGRLTPVIWQVEGNRKPFEMLSIFRCKMCSDVIWFITHAKCSRAIFSRFQ